MIIEVQDTPASNKEINTLVDDAIQKDVTPLPGPKDDTLFKKSPSLSTILLPNDPKIDSFTKVSTSGKVKNFFSLLAPYCSGCKRKAPSCFGLIVADKVTILDNVNIAFIAVSREPKTYQEAIHSSHSEQWEQAIKLEFVQLQKLGIFEVVNVSQTSFRP